MIFKNSPVDPWMLLFESRAMSFFEGAMRQTEGPRTVQESHIRVTLPVLTLVGPIGDQLELYYVEGVWKLP